MSTRILLIIAILATAISLAHRPELVLAQEDDPFATPTHSAPTGAPGTEHVTTPDRPPASAPPSTSPVAPAQDSQCAELSESMCSRANTTFLSMCGGYVALALLIFVAWASYWSGRGATSTGLKVGVPLLLGGLSAGFAVGSDPFASENYLCCVADPTFRAALLLGDSGLARGVVLGVLPFVALFVASLSVVQSIRRRRV